MKHLLISETTPTISRTDALRRVRRARGATGRVLALVLAGMLCPGMAAANGFCDTLHSIAAEAPGFEALKGREFLPGGAVPDHYGTIAFAGTKQCVVRDEGYGASGDADFGPDVHYECVWDNIAPAGLDWAKNQVTTCYPGASYVDGVKYGSGGTFAIGSVTVQVHYADYGSLWLTIR